MGFLANRRRLSDRKSKPDILKLQVSVQGRGERKAAEITELLVPLRNASKAGAVVDEVQDKEWPVVGWGNDRAGTKENLASGGLRPAGGKDENWAGLTAHFDETLVG